MHHVSFTGVVCRYHYFGVFRRHTSAIRRCSSLTDVVIVGSLQTLAHCDSAKAMPCATIPCQPRPNPPLYPLPRAIPRRSSQASQSRHAPDSTRSLASPQRVHTGDSGLAVDRLASSQSFQSTHWPRGSMFRTTRRQRRHVASSRSTSPWVSCSRRRLHASVRAALRRVLAARAYSWWRGSAHSGGAYMTCCSHVLQRPV